ncbi:MBL fold metallo-hydrolase [Agaribacterium haliotis]|uniref:MBL fold metallo-hydrolase n=1 Tax=Agaribacterium haliotis TaxID=2013869 RepID=UPI001EFC49EA|nr:MBL fold metallo-hydrolase [Agaribacterium haliotis]
MPGAVVNSPEAPGAELRFASLGSGSGGNATVVAWQDQALLIDCGFSARECLARLKRLDLDPGCLSAILLSHEHGDHSKGVAALARKLDIPVYMSAGTAAAMDFGRLPALHKISAEQPIELGGLTALPVTVAHDAREPLQYVLEHRGLRLGVLTDLGSLTPAVYSAYDALHGLLVEANHDLRMLACGPYPPSLQARVRAPWGHLNNEQCAALLADLDLSLMQHLVVGHISRKNNHLDCVKAALADAVQALPSVVYACQDEGVPWLALKLP